jgi:hypothetical protein
MEGENIRVPQPGFPSRLRDGSKYRRTEGWKPPIINQNRQPQSTSAPTAQLHTPPTSQPPQQPQRNGHPTASSVSVSSQQVDRGQTILPYPQHSQPHRPPPARAPLVGILQFNGAPQPMPHARQLPAPVISHHPGVEQRPAWANPTLPPIQPAPMPSGVQLTPVASSGAAQDSRVPIKVESDVRTMLERELESS